MSAGGLVLPEEGATLAAGARLAHALRTEPGPLVIALAGPLGSGKTTLVRGLLRALGVSGTVRSPTYTLVEEHRTAAWEVLHLDLYRLAAGDTLAELGLRDRHEPGTLLLIEWPERAHAAALPPVDLTLALDHATGVHRLDARAHSAPGRKLLQALLTEVPDETSLSS